MADERVAAVGSLAKAIFEAVFARSREALTKALDELAVYDPGAILSMKTAKDYFGSHFVFAVEARDVEVTRAISEVEIASLGAMIGVIENHPADLIVSVNPNWLVDWPEPDEPAPDPYENCDPWAGSDFEE